MTTFETLWRGLVQKRRRPHPTELSRRQSLQRRDRSSCSHGLPPLTASLMILLLRIDASSAEAKAFLPAFHHSPPSGFSARSGGGGEGGLQRFPRGIGNVDTVIFGASSSAASLSGAPSFGTSSEVTSLFVCNLCASSEVASSCCISCVCLCM